MNPIEQSDRKLIGFGRFRAALWLLPLLGLRTKSRRRHYLLLAGVRAGVPMLAFLFVLSATAAPQVAWVTRHNFDNPSRTNQVVAMTLDDSGHIILAGTSATTNGDFDYAVLKYSPTGVQQWAATYNSGPLADDQLRGMTVDGNGNVYVTGTSKTVKFDSAGLLQWAAPYGGRALAVDSSEFLYVVGFQEQDFATVKIAPQGTNVWLRTYDHVGLQDIAQVVAVGVMGEVYVGGTVTWFCDRIFCYVKLAVIKYDVDGNRLWLRDDVLSCNAIYGGEVKNLVVLHSDQICATGNFYASCLGLYRVQVFDANGTKKWSFATSASDGGMTSMVVLQSGELYLTGRIDARPVVVFCRTIALNTNGTLRWQADFGPSDMYHSGHSIALDAAGNVYVAGQQPGTDPDQLPDFLLIKYDNDGHQQWLQRYNGPANGSDVATGIAVGADGAIYVAGHSANTNGGTDITLIKYVELQNIQMQTNQSVLLQFLGTPGQNYRFQSTTNFSDWDELGAAIADPLGLYQWLDTNPPGPHKFYRTVTP